MKREDKKEEKKTNAKIKTRRRSRNASYASWITCGTSQVRTREVLIENGMLWTLKTHKKKKKKIFMNRVPVSRYVYLEYDT